MFLQKPRINKPKTDSKEDFFAILHEVLKGRASWGINQLSAISNLTTSCRLILHTGPLSNELISQLIKNSDWLIIWVIHHGKTLNICSSRFARVKHSCLFFLSFKSLLIEELISSCWLGQKMKFEDLELYEAMVSILLFFFWHFVQNTNHVGKQRSIKQLCAESECTMRSIQQKSQNINKTI